MASYIGMSRFDVIVVGLGGMGSAAAAHAASRGKRVLGIEQFQPAHDQGSSHGRSRVIRLAYFEHPAYVPLLRRAYELWRQLEERTGRRLLQITGGLMIGDARERRRQRQPAKRARASSRSRDARCGADPRAIPALTPAARRVALFENEAGMVFPEEAIRAHLDFAVDNGAHVHFDERVEELGRLRPSGRIDVRTSRGRYECDRLILAPGSWAAELFKIDWLPLEVEPQQLHWFDPGRRPGAVSMPDRFPIYIWDLGNGIQFYGFPADDEGRVKVAFFRSRVKGEAAMREALRAMHTRRWRPAHYWRP